MFGCKESFRISSPGKQDLEYKIITFKIFRVRKTKPRVYKQNLYNFPNTEITGPPRYSFGDIGKYSTRYHVLFLLTRAANIATVAAAIITEAIAAAGGTVFLTAVGESFSASSSSV